MNSILKNNLLWTHGKGIVLSLLVLAIFFFMFFKSALIIILFLFLFSLYFFRNPKRHSNFYSDCSVLICPADGTIIDISEGNFEGYSKKIAIFLSPFDVHVNWIPCDGEIKKVNYKPGKFIVAYAPKSSDINERNDIIINCKNGKNILIRQIAGFVARRICCWVKEKDSVNTGQKYGMIRFGSRVDILIPSNIDISVKIGSKVKGGETCLGRWL